MQNKLSKKKEIILDKNRPIDHLIELSATIRSGRDPTDPCRPQLVTTGEVFFRGEPAFYQSYLTPKIYRNSYNLFEEGELILDFKSTFSKYRKTCFSEIDWLSVMQHYGIPTRLLDWSRNPLVALYFSIGQNEHLEEDGIIYIFPICNRFGEKQLSKPITSSVKKYIDVYTELALANSFTEVKNILLENIPHHSIASGVKFEIDGYKIKKIILAGYSQNMFPLFFDHAIEVFPKNSHPRIRAQYGCFTIHFGKYINKIEVLPSLMDEAEKSYFQFNFYKLIIPSTIKNSLLRSLRLMQVHEFSLFPEEDKFYNYFTQKKI
jgi:hypothetical protein